MDETWVNTGEFAIKIFQTGSSNHSGKGKRYYLLFILKTKMFSCKVVLWVLNRKKHKRLLGEMNGDVLKEWLSRIYLVKDNTTFYYRLLFGTT